MKNHKTSRHQGFNRTLLGIWCLLVTISVLGFACSHPFSLLQSGEPAQTGQPLAGGRLIVQPTGAPQAGLRSIMPDEIDKASLVYIITASRDGYETIVSEILPYAESGLELDALLALGNWNIKLEARANDSQTILFSGQSEIEIALAFNSAVIHLFPCQTGQGSFALNLSWPADQVDRVQFTWLTAFDGTATTAPDGLGDPTLNLATGNLSLSSVAVASGHYYLQVLLEIDVDKSGVYQTVARVLESVYIFDERHSAKTITLAAGQLSAPPEAPGAPAVAFIKDSGTVTGIRVNWIDNSHTEEGFRVFRQAAAGEAINISGNLPSGSPDFADEAFADVFATPDIEITYFVESYNLFGTSRVSAGVLPSIPGASSDLSVAMERNPEDIINATKLSWTDNSSAEAGYRVYRRIGSTGDYSLLASLAADSQNYIDSVIGDFPHEETVCYQVVAYTEYSESAASSADIFWNAGGRDLLGFDFPGVGGGTDFLTQVLVHIDDDGADNGTVDISVPRGSILTNLVASFTLSEHAKAVVVDVPQVSSGSSNNYSANLTFTVIAGDGSQRNYTIRVGNAHIFTVDTRNPDPLASDYTIKGRVNMEEGFFVLFWEGQSRRSTVSNSETRKVEFSEPATYDIAVLGINGISHGSDASNYKLIDVRQWGSAVWSQNSASGLVDAFYKCKELASFSAEDTPDLSQATALMGMFNSASKFNGNIGNWDTGNIIFMSQMFIFATAFNQDVSSWNVSNVTDMRYLFRAATSFNNGGVALNWGEKTAAVTTMSQMFFEATAFNQNVSSWNVSNVTDMSSMFNGATAFNQDVSSWNVSNVTDMSSMFRAATSFNNGGTALNWGEKTDAVTNMSFLFSDATAFNQDISSWEIRAVTNIGNMFSYATSFDNGGVALNWGDKTAAVTNMRFMFFGATAFNQDISSWDVGAVTTILSMFHGATAFNQPIGSWNVGAVTNMASMFSGAAAFNQDISSWNVSAVTTMQSMFSNATAFNQNISTWNVSAVADMGFLFNDAISFNNGGASLNWGEKTAAVTTLFFMFDGATVFNQDISTWNVSNVTTMQCMFRNATAFNQDISTWNVGAVTTMSAMFNGATAFNQDISGWDVTAVTTMSAMFSGATAFNNGEAALSWGNKTMAVTSMREMFRYASGFNQDISGWDVSAVSSMREMFRSASGFNQDISSWDVSAVTSMREMFRSASGFNQNISSWDVSTVTDMYMMFYDASSFDRVLGTWNIGAVVDVSVNSGMRSMLFGSGLSVVNYSNTLSGWSAYADSNNLPKNITLNAGSTIKYNSGAADARNNLITNHSWTITDGGLE